MANNSLHLRGRRASGVRAGLAGLVMVAGLTLVAADPASAFIFVSPAPSFPDTVTVGQTFPAALGIQNASTPPESVTNPVLTISQVDLAPACTNMNVDCAGGIEAGVFGLSATGLGSGPPSCTGTWTLTQTSPGVWRFTPPGGEGTASVGTGETCVVDFTLTVLRVPTIDVNPGQPGVQTNQIASTTASGPTTPPVRNSGSDRTTVFPGQTSIVTQATTTTSVGGSISDTASVTAPAAGPAPTGTVTFTLYGPNDATCVGPPTFTSANRPLTGGPPTATATSGSFAAASAGTYRWVATYNGDANYLPVTSACNDANETSVVTRVQPQIVTQATAIATLGQPISDTATLSGGFNPTGTITFTAYGPNNPTCTGAPVFTAGPVPVNVNGQSASGPFFPPAAGSYRWIATYSGDANNFSAQGTCGDANETSIVQQVQPQIVTQATPTATVGQPISDTATLSGGFNPTGTITFRVYGPNNPTCTGAAAFTSAPVPVNGNGQYLSGPFTPNAAGSYRWIATYSGDANNNPVQGNCGDPNETSTVNPASNPTIVTQATPTAFTGQPITDTATLSGAFNPTGTITFTLFGPNNPTCTGAPVFTSTVPVSGNGSYTSTPPFVPPAAGSYNWVASYSGDVNNIPATSSCGAPNETSFVQQISPTIVTQATPTVNLGQPISDTATLSGGFNPTGTITFSVYGPNNPTCTGAPVFTSAPVPVNGNGQYASGPFVPPAAGSYRWIATYSGDANNLPVLGTCGDPNETSTVNPAPIPTILTQATTPVPLGQPISDTATLSGGSNPTGTLTFTLFGPNNPTCAGAPVFTSTVPVSGNGNYNSGNFTPTAPGSYNWVAVYSGDANNPPVTSSCGAPNETSVVTKATPLVATAATPNATLGGSISDTAAVIGGANLPAPTGTVTFNVYGPNNPTCTGAPVFTSANRTLGGGPPSAVATTAPFTPTQAGTYRWVASYSGDANYAAVTAPCNAPNETSTVTAVSPIAVFRPSNGLWFFHNGPAVHWGTQGDIAVPADYDGNGTEDIAVFRPSNGYWFVRNGVTVQFGISGDIPVPADYDGDGDDDIAVFRPSNGLWFVFNGPTLQFGGSLDVPVPADYNGDGIDEIAIFRPLLGLWLLANGGGTQFGILGDVPVPADYNGDGIDEVAVYRQSTGQWLLQSGGIFGTVVNWGISGDIPVPADYDGDGDEDIAVFRPSNGVWFVLNGPTVAWGTAGDDPLPLPAAVREAYFP